MKGKIFVLKRSNGFCGIYVDGYKQENLKSNFMLTDKAENLFDSVKRESAKQLKNGNICEVIFTEHEELFKSELPTLKEYLRD